MEFKVDLTSTILGRPIPDKKLSFVESAGYAIYLLRKYKSISGTKFGKLVGLSQSQISRLEKGEQCLDLNNIEHFCQVLEISTEDYFKLVHLIYSFTNQGELK